MIFTEDLFIGIKNRIQHGGSFLVGIAHHYKECQGLIEQLNKIFDSLPNNMKSDIRFQKAITSTNSADFKGAFGELVTYNLLKKYSDKVLYNPRIGKFTPDFYVDLDSHTFMVEAFCVGESTQEELQRRYYSEVTSQLKDFNGRRSIIFDSDFTPDENSQFTGIGKEILEYVNSLPKSDLDKKLFFKSRRGASLSFSVHEHEEEMPFCSGAITGGWGDQRSINISERLREKRRKYEFPILVSCVVDSLIRASLGNMIKVLVGTPQIRFKIDPQSGIIQEGSQESTYSYDGFWGIKNPNFVTNHHVQGVLFTRTQNSNDGLSFYTHLFENPYFKTGLGSVFPSIPDPLKGNQEGFIEDIPGFKFS